MPQRGPLASQRRSLAIFISEAARVFSAHRWAMTSASWGGGARRICSARVDEGDSWSARRSSSRRARRIRGCVFRSGADRAAPEGEFADVGQDHLDAP